MDKPKKGLKKLQAIVPIQERSKPKELRDNTISKKEEKYIKDIHITFPQQSTLIPIRPKLPITILDASGISKTGLKSIDLSAKFELDIERNILVIDDGRGNKIKYDLDTLVSENSRVGKSIDKKSAIELANVYLKLGIKPQLKKQEFIKQIRAKINLPPEESL